MKVILEAFNGKLKSEPLDFPENSSPEIQMVLDFRPTPHIGELPVSETPLTKRGHFQWTGNFYLLSDKKTSARRYVLVDIG